MLKEKIGVTFNLDEVADTLTEGIRFLKSHGLDSTEIRTIDGKNIARLSFDETQELKRTLDSNNIRVTAIASPLFKWYSGNPTEERKADLFGMSPYLTRVEKEQMILKVIDQAVILETKKIRIFSGLRSNDGHEPLPIEESELLVFALNVAKEKNVTLLLENEPVCYISRLSDYTDIFTSGKYDGLRSWFDIANVYEEGESITRSDVIDLLPFIDYLHIKDRVAPDVHKYVPLGRGYINYKRIFDILEELINRPLELSIETHVKDDKWSASSESLDYLYRLLSTKRTSYALIGLGRVSQKHLSALKSNDNCTLVGVFDTNAAKTTQVASAFDCLYFENLDELLMNEDVEVVSICTPHDTHTVYAKAILDSGKKVLSEKPLARTANELKNFIEQVDHNDHTFVIFQNRFNPAIKKFYEFEKNKLGVPQYIAMTLRWWRDTEYYKDWHGSQEISGGALITQAIHSLELVTHLTKGSRVKNIHARQVRTRDDVTIPDIIIASIEFENGIICNIEVCLATRESNLESSMFVVGTNGSMKVGGIALSEIQHPVTDTVDLENAKHYYGNGHSALYKTHSNHCLESFDEDDHLLMRPAGLLSTLQLIEEIEMALGIV